jgi:hypothetical protein
MKWRTTRMRMLWTVWFRNISVPAAAAVTSEACQAMKWRTTRMRMLWTVWFRNISVPAAAVAAAVPTSEACQAMKWRTTRMRRLWTVWFRNISNHPRCSLYFYCIRKEYLRYFLIQIYCISTK